MGCNSPHSTKYVCCWLETWDIYSFGGGGGPGPKSTELNVKEVGGPGGSTGLETKRTYQAGAPISGEMGI